MDSGFYSIENRIIVKFGGKIGVGLGLNEERKNVSIILQELQGEHDIGKIEPETYKEDEPAIQLIFENTKSIDVVINLLNQAKKQLEEYVRTTRIESNNE